MVLGSGILSLGILRLASIAYHPELTLTFMPYSIHVKCLCLRKWKISNIGYTAGSLGALSCKFGIGQIRNSSTQLG